MKLEPAARNQVLVPFWKRTCLAYKPIYDVGEFLLESIWYNICLSCSRIALLFVASHSMSVRSRLI